MTATKARLMSTLILALLLTGTHQAKAQTDPIFNILYERYGVSAQVPDGFHVEEADIIWKANKTYERNFSGRIVNVLAKSDDGNCILLYPNALQSLLIKGKEDRLDGQMALINREMMEGFGILSESGMTTINNTSAADLFYAEEHITRISGESIVRMTGADLVCLYDLPVENTEFFRGASKLEGFNSKTLTRIHVIKEGGAHYDIIMLLNEDGAKRNWTYLQSFLENIRFDSKRIRQTWEVIEK